MTNRPTRRDALRTISGGIGAAALPGSVPAAARRNDHELWRFDTGDAARSPTVVDGTAYVGSHKGRLHAIDTDDGEELWNYESGRFPGSTAPHVVDVDR